MKERVGGSGEYSCMNIEGDGGFCWVSGDVGWLAKRGLYIFFYKIVN